MSATEEICILKTITAQVMIRDDGEVITGEVEIPLELGKLIPKEPLGSKEVREEARYVRQLIDGEDSVVDAAARAIVGQVNRMRLHLKPMGKRVFLMDSPRASFAFVLKDNEDLPGLMVKGAALNLKENHHQVTLGGDLLSPRSLIANPEVDELHQDIWEVPFQDMCSSSRSVNLMVRESWKRMSDLQVDFIFQAKASGLGVQAQARVARDLAAEAQVELDKIMNDVTSKES